MTPEEVPGRISAEVGRTLRSLAHNVPADEIIVEIGAFKGRSTCFLADGSHKGHGARVISIDPWDTPGNIPGPKRAGPIYLDPDNKAAQRRHLEACRVGYLVTSIQGFSWDVELPDEPVGLLWIDGAHDYQSVSRDIERWSPLVVSGGHVAFDDYRAKCPGVDRAVDEMMRRPEWPHWDLSVDTLAVGRRG